MADKKVQYQVEVVKTGNGGAAAAAELNSVAAAATSANKAGANLKFVYDPGTFKQTGDAARVAANQLTGLSRTATTTMQGMNMLRASVALVGFQAFPQLTMAALAGSNALQGIRGVSLLTGASLGTVGVAVTALAATVATGATAWAAYTAGLPG